MARPNLSYLKNLLLVLFGFPCGILTGLTAIGNGILVVPGLKFLSGLGSNRAAPASVAATCVAGLGAILAIQKLDIRWTIIIPLLIGQIFGVIWAQRLVSKWALPPWLPKLGAVLIVVMGALLLYSRSLHITSVAASFSFGGGALSSTALAIAILLAVAVLAGFTGGLFQIGGVFLILAEVLILRMPAHLAEGTAIIVLVIAALPAVLAHGLRGTLSGRPVTWVPFGAFFGGMIGSYASCHLSDHQSLVAIGIACMIIGVVSLVLRPEVEQLPTDDTLAAADTLK